MKKITNSNLNKPKPIGASRYATQNKQPHVGAGSVSAQNAITLVALVITIIVLLILAGVTINLTLGNNGIFNTAQKAAKNYTEAQNKELADLNEFNDTVQALGTKLGTIIKTENNINYTADGAGNIIPVPAGFSPITAEEGQGTKETGFVIRNDVDKNEFVWVPVIGMGYNYNRYDFGKQNGKFSDYSEEIPRDEQLSVTTYGGYYIGRYEAGISSETARVSADSNVLETSDQIASIWGKPLSQAKKHTYNRVTRDQAKGLSEMVYTKTDDNVMSRLCSSYTWDTTLKFINSNMKNKEFIINGTGGNYLTVSGGTGVLQKTGYHRINNIYDIGGNAWEWTTESCDGPNGPCVLRGGSYQDDASVYTPSFRNYNYNATYSFPYYGFRFTLFM